MSCFPSALKPTQNAMLSYLFEFSTHPLSAVDVGRIKKIHIKIRNTYPNLIHFAQTTHA